MARTIVNKTQTPLHIVGLGNLEPGDNEITAEQEEEFEVKTGKKLADLKSSPQLDVKGSKAKKEDDDS